jgi:hypothetical protein
MYSSLWVISSFVIGFLVGGICGIVIMEIYVAAKGENDKNVKY